MPDLHDRFAVLSLDAGQLLNQRLEAADHYFFQGRLGWWL